MNIDEIKKGLECCSSVSIRCCIGCPYNSNKDWLDCNAEKMHKDALNLINNQENQIAELQKEVDNLKFRVIEKLKEKSFYIQTAEDNYHVVELSTIEKLLEDYNKL